MEIRFYIININLRNKIKINSYLVIKYLFAIEIN